MAGLANSFGRGVMTNHFVDYKNSDVLLLFGCNPAENHPMAFRWITKAREERGAKIIVIDPRFSKSAALADIWVPIRPGTDIAFLNGLMNYAIQNNLYFHDYVVNYTNASYLIDPSFGLPGDNDGVFSGFKPQDGDKPVGYDTKSWQYQKNGEEVAKDPTLQNPNCVFQLLKKHLARYDAKTVCNITGCSEDQFIEAAKTYCSTGRPDKAGNLLYAMGITQHSYGAQNVRGTAMLQLLLGNIGIAGGGVNAQRGESNVQGSTDMAMLFHLLPGYLSCPSAPVHPSLQAYLEKETPKTGYWSNKPKFLISQLKAWFGAHATAGNNFCYDWLPKLDGKDHSHITIFETMAQGKIKGFFAWGQNPAVGGPGALATKKAMEQLDWMVSVDMVETETACFWKRPGVDPKSIKTEVFFLPACGSYEKEGTVANSGRWLQYRWPAIKPLGDSRSDLWICDKLFKAIRAEYATGGKFTDPLMKMTWNYDGHGDEPNIDQVMLEINGFTVADNKALPSFAGLKNDGSTACGCWVYGGYFANDPELGVPACKRRDRTDKSGLGLYPKWSFAWPVNRRIVYNRASCDPAGNPWDPQRALMKWDGAKWVTNDVPDFGAVDAKTKAPIPPATSAKAAFMMQPEGVSRLFANALKDGPFPEHYEPVESPVKNLISKQQSNPLVPKRSGDFGIVAKTGDPNFPYIGTTHRVIEHYQSGALTRNCPLLVELMPEVFVSVSPKLAKSLGLVNGGWAEVSSARGKIKCKVCVTPIMRPLVINGQECEVVGVPWHWGYSTLAPGETANDLTHCISDPNTNIPEYKAFLCNVKPA